MRWLLLLGVSGVVVACAPTWSEGKKVAAAAISCPQSDFATLVPNRYNLGPGEHLYRGCGRDVVVHCLSWQHQAYCQVDYVSAASPK